MRRYEKINFIYNIFQIRDFMLKQLIDNMIRISKIRIPVYSESSYSLDNINIWGLMYIGNIKELCGTIQNIESNLYRVKEAYLDEKQVLIDSLKNGVNFLNKELPYKAACPDRELKRLDVALNELESLYESTIKVFCEYRLSLLAEAGLNEKIGVMKTIYSNNFCQKKSDSFPSLLELSYKKLTKELNKSLEIIHKKNLFLLSSELSETKYKPNF